MEKDRVWRGLLFTPYILFDYACSAKSVIGAVFLDRSETFGGNGDCERFVDLRNIHALFLQVCILAVVAGRSKHSRTSAVRVLAAHERGLFRDSAFFCHSGEIVP